MQTTGRFADGRTAALRPVTAELGATELIVRENGVECAHWPLASLRSIDEPGGAGPLRVKCSDDGAERLTLDDPEFAAALRAAAPALSGRLRHRWSWRRAGAWAAGVLVFGLFVAFGIARLSEIAAALVPLSWEQRVGDKVVAMVVARVHAKGYCSTEAGDAALSRLAHRLGAAAHMPDPVVVRVADSAVVNAFAAPGGRIVILRGLIDKAASADELAGVLAHEMGHVIERHPTQALFRVVGVNLVITAMFGDSSSIGSTLAQAGGVLAMFSYSRGNEAEADRDAVTMLNEANIRGDGLVAFFARAAGHHRAASSGPDAYLSTHPSSASRAAAIHAAATGTGPAMSDAEWQALKTICRP